MHQNIPSLTGEPAYTIDQKGSQQEAPDHYSDHMLPSLPIDQFPDAVLTLSRDGVVQQANAACATILGYGEMHGHFYTQYVLPEDEETVKNFIEKAPALGPVTNFVHRFQRKDGTMCSISWSSFWSEKEALIYCIGRDVTELHKAQAKQVASEQLLQAVIENSFDLLALIDEQGNYLYVSESVYQAFNYKTDAILGYKAKDLIGTNCFTYMHPDDLPWLLAQFKTLFEGEKKIQVSPYRFKDAQGHWHWLEAVVTNQLNHPDIKAIVVSCREISQQIETNEKLKEMQMLEALVEGEEKERSRIARDLHDGISGMIAAAKMQFSALGEKLDEAPALKEFVQGMDLLEKAARQVRATSHNLMPEILLENGLSEALRRYCCNISHDNFMVDYCYIGDMIRFSPNFELSLYRIAQELIGNIIRHSGAGQALIQLSYQQGLLSLTIEDQGKGFFYDPSLEGTGLRSVKKRVEAMNGHLEIHSAPGKGTSIYIEFGS